MKNWGKKNEVYADRDKMSEQKELGLKQQEKQKNLLLLMCASLQDAEVHLSFPDLTLPFLLEFSKCIIISV